MLQKITGPVREFGAFAGALYAADRVMRGGMLIGCHHGLDDAQIDYVQAQAAKFLDEYR